jgi:hypothetical protein
LTTQHANTKDVCVLDAKVDAKIVKRGMDSKKIREDGLCHKSRRFGRKKSVDKAAKERDNIRVGVPEDTCQNPCPA